MRGDHAHGTERHQAENQGGGASGPCQLMVWGMLSAKEARQDTTLTLTQTANRCSRQASPSQGLGAGGLQCCIPHRQLEPPACKFHRDYLWVPVGPHSERLERMRPTIRAWPQAVQRHTEPLEMVGPTSQHAHNLEHQSSSHLPIQATIHAQGQAGGQAEAGHHPGGGSLRLFGGRLHSCPGAAHPPGGALLWPGLVQGERSFYLTPPNMHACSSSRTAGLRLVPGWCKVQACSCGSWGLTGVG